VEGIEALKDGADAAMNRILTDKDFKRIRIAKLKNAVRQTGYSHKIGGGEGSDSSD
jgi:hypothetical protein